jgi:hypothetical protein
VQNTTDPIESGAWVGRQQAFAVIASKCSAAQALALREIKESKAFEQFGLTWKEFCLKHVGMSRESADLLIRQYNEFGDAYFRLSQIARISPETYRQIQPKVGGDIVEINGENYELTLPNAGRIRAAIAKMRHERDEARRAADAREPLELNVLRSRQDALIEEARRLVFYYHPQSGRRDLVQLATHAINRWKTAAKEFAEP